MKLIRLAAQTPDDPAARYVMLRDAHELAAGVADTALALLAIDAMARWYEMDGAARRPPPWTGC